MENKMTPQEALEILKNINAHIQHNHIIGGRQCANEELEEFYNSIEKYVIPTFENALNELEQVKKLYNNEKFIRLVLEEEKEQLKKQLATIKNETIDMCKEELMPIFLMFDYEVMKEWTNKLDNLKEKSND